MRKKLTINHWFSQHESSLHAVLNGYLDENLPDWLKETLFEHSIKSVRRRQEVVQIRRQKVAQTPFQGV